MMNVVRATPHHFLAVHIFFFHDAESLGDFLVGVGEQGEGQVELLLEFLLRFRSVGRYAKQHGARLLHLFVCVAEPASFDGSTRSVGAGIKVENDGLAAQVFQRDFFSVLVLQSEVGSLIIDLHGSFSGEIEVECREAADQAAFGKLAFQQDFIPRIAFRRAARMRCVCGRSSLTAQEERPQITPGERKAPRKKDAGPRAVAVLQLAANGKASLVPIAILVGGKFWDATAYKADPVPMALEPGTVYEAERAGSSLGLFTVNSALHSNAVNVQTPWIGTGSWVPAGTENAEDGAQGGEARRWESIPATRLHGSPEAHEGSRHLRAPATSPRASISPAVAIRGRTASA